MPLDGTEVRVGITGHLYTAPVGTAMPTTTTAALPAIWVELGYTEEGPVISTDTNVEDFIPWQSRTAVRSVVTEATMTIAFTLWQRNAQTLKLAFGGGTVTAGTGTGQVIYRPPLEANLVEQAFVFEILDGPIIDRYCLYRGSPSLADDISFAKDSVTGYPLEVKFLDTAAGAWQLITNDPAVEADETA